MVRPGVTARVVHALSPSLAYALFWTSPPPWPPAGGAAPSARGPASAPDRRRRTSPQPSPTRPLRWRDEIPRDVARLEESARERTSALDGLGPHDRHGHAEERRRAGRGVVVLTSHKGPAPSGPARWGRSEWCWRLAASRLRRLLSLQTTTAPSPNRTSLLNNPLRSALTSSSPWNLGVTIAATSRGASSPSAPADRCRARPARRRPPPATARALEPHVKLIDLAQARQRRVDVDQAGPGYTAPRRAAAAVASRTRLTASGAGFCRTPSPRSRQRRRRRCSAPPSTCRA